MQITTTKIYEKSFTVENGEEEEILSSLSSSMDVTITDLKYPEEIDTIRAYLSQWNEELTFDSLSRDEKYQDIPPSLIKSAPVEEVRCLEEIRVKVCRDIERVAPKGAPLSICFVYSKVLSWSADPVSDPDKVFSIFFGTIYYLRSQGYFFNWG